jgi:hypothetical protein
LGFDPGWTVKLATAIEKSALLAPPNCGLVMCSAVVPVFDTDSDPPNEVDPIAVFGNEIVLPGAGLEEKTGPAAAVGITGIMAVKSTKMVARVRQNRNGRMGPLLRLQERECYSLLTSAISRSLDFTINPSCAGGTVLSRVRSAGPFLTRIRFAVVFILLTEGKRGNQLA